MPLAYPKAHALCMLLLPAALAMAQPPPPPAGLALGEVWRLGSAAFAEEAGDALGQLSEQVRQAPDARLAGALSLMLRQPQTQGNQRRAAAELEAVAQAHPGTDFEAMALYYRGRLEQVHAIEPDARRALPWYRKAADARPGTLWADLARLQLSTIQLLDEEWGGDWATRVRRAGEELAEIQRPVVRVSFHLMVSNALLRADQELETALEHVIAAHREGIVRETVRSDALVRIGTLLRELDRHAEAAPYYREFLRDFPRDNRFNLITARLAEISTPEAE